MRLLFIAIATNIVVMAIKSGIIDDTNGFVSRRASVSYTKRLILCEVFSL